MQGQRGFWDVEDRLKELSAEGDPLERLAEAVDFELSRPVLVEALGRSDPSKGGRPGFDPVLKFKMLVLGAMHGLSLQQTDYLVWDRLSWMRCCGLGPGDSVPDAKTLWDFREALIAAKALDDLFVQLDRVIPDAGYVPMAGQIVDVTLVAALRQCNSDGEKAEIKAGRIPAGWKDKPAKLRQKDRDARWTVKFSKAKMDENDRVQQRDIAACSLGRQRGNGIRAVLGTACRSGGSGRGRYPADTTDSSSRRRRRVFTQAPEDYWGDAKPLGHWECPDLC